MPFISEIIKCNSLSIVGLEKNTGKTECLNYILKRLPQENYKVAVTSIGIDGETVDNVTKTSKPEIHIENGVYFSTSEAHYRKRKLYSELVDITEEWSSLGRIVTAKALCGGKVLLSGPSSGTALKRWMESLNAFGVDLRIVDGALSRLSLASPAVSEAMILSTGAALSANMNTLVRKTAFVVELIGIEVAERQYIDMFMGVENGIWGVDDNGEAIDFKIQSSLSFNGFNSDIAKKCRVIYVSGALTERFLKILIGMEREILLLVRDFTKIFVSELVYREFSKRGGSIKVLQRSKLIAVCVNPTSPEGYVMDSDLLCENLERAIGLPVYDIVRNNAF